MTAADWFTFLYWLDGITDVAAMLFMVAFLALSPALRQEQ